MTETETITSLALQLLKKELALPLSELSKRLLKQIDQLESSDTPQLKGIDEQDITAALSKLREQDFVRAISAGGGGDLIFSITGKGLLELEETRAKFLVEKLGNLL